MRLFIIVSVRVFLAPRRVLWPVVVALATVITVRAQTPVDSSWVLDRGDTLFFHRGGEREYARGAHDREWRFPDGRRISFLTPKPFVSSALPTHRFREINLLPSAISTVLQFTLAPAYTAPRVTAASFPGGALVAGSREKGAGARGHAFRVVFEDPGWYVVEIAANTHSMEMHVLARILVCVGDRLPLPFDTVREEHVTPMQIPTPERIVDVCAKDHARPKGLALARDSAFEEALLDLVMRPEFHRVRLGLLAPEHLRAAAAARRVACDSTMRGAVVVTGHTAEEIAWTIRTSPTLRQFELLPRATAVSVAVTRVRDDYVALVAFFTP